MSDWMVSEVVRCGGVETTYAHDPDYNIVRATYRGFYLYWCGWGTVLHVARVVDFDRWANSRIYEGEAPTTIEALDTLLDGLTRSTFDPRAAAFQRAWEALYGAGG